MSLCRLVRDGGRAMARKRGMGQLKAWEGTQAQGGPMRTRWRVVLWAGHLKESFFFFSLPLNTSSEKS